jgi:hypothetical protein
VKLKKGDIVLAEFPFTDLSQKKLRPALVLWASPSIGDRQNLDFAILAYLIISHRHRTTSQWHKNFM